MRKLTILIDMDDTITDLIGAWTAALNNQYDLAITPDDVTGWDIERFFPMLTKEQVFAPLYYDAFWEHVRPKDNAASVLQKLINDGHDVFIVTSSYYQTLPAKMENVLFRHFPFLSWDNVIVTGKKWMIKGDVLIDDGAHNMEGGEYEKILIDTARNQNYDDKRNGVTRVKDLTEAYEKICELACA